MRGIPAVAAMIAMLGGTLAGLAEEPAVAPVQPVIGERLTEAEITVADDASAAAAEWSAEQAFPLAVKGDLSDEPVPAPRQNQGTAPTIRQSFPGARRGDAGQIGYPADASGAVGPYHFVEASNGQYQVFDRFSGSRLINIALGSFFSPLPTRGSPRVLYDQHSGRWIVIACNFDTDGRIQMAVSRTGDPTPAAGWFKFSFVAAGGDEAGCWPDYPTLGLDAGGIYIAAYMTNCDAMSIFAIDKAPLIAAVPSMPTITAFRGTAIGIGFEGAIQPAHTYGSPGVEYFVSRGTATTVRLRRIMGPITSPTLSSLPSVVVPQYQPPPSAAALESSPNISTLDQRMMNAVYRNGSLWTVHTVNVSSFAACRWYQVNPATSALVQSGTVSDAARHYYYPSIAVNSRGDAVVGCSGSSAGEYIGAWLAGRKASDAAGEMSPPLQLAPGEGAINFLDALSRNRWGDYTMTALDPVSELEFWTVLAHASTNNNWATRIARLDYGDCNNNGIADDCDISCLAPGCNVPGCGQATDCDASGTPDSCERYWHDCNANLTHDACDLAAGSSADCNTNGIPDECDAVGDDCNANARPDSCDVTDLRSQIVDPEGQISCDGESVFLSVAGPPGATYRWYRDNLPVTESGTVTGVTTPVLGFDPVSLADGGAYYCRVSNGCISADSAAAELSIISHSLNATLQPVAQSTVCVSTGQPAQFEFHVNNETAVAYHWYKDGAPLEDDGRIGGAHTAILHIAPVSPSDSGMYRCAASNPCGGAVSSDPALGKLTAVGTRFEAGPFAMCAEAGGAAAFRARVSSSPGSTYFWYRDGDLVSDGADPAGMTASGAATPELVLQNVPAAYNGASFVLVGFVDAPTCVSSSAPVDLAVGGCGLCGYSGDMDGDLDVDLADLAAFAGCFGGAAAGGEVCTCADLASGGAVIDLQDWSAAEQRITGPR